MIISDTAVKNRISVVVLSILVIIFGTYCYMVLPRESAPDITIPVVFVSTNYKGVSSADMEKSVTIPIEKKLKGLEGVKKIKSVSSEGQSQINIEFVTGMDIDDAIQKVRDKVDEAKGELPSDLEDDPVVFEVNFSELPIVVYSLSGTCGSRCLKDIADKLEEDIESIQGVLEVDVTGGREREIRIEVDPDKLAYYRIPITKLQQVVSSENQNTSGGSITLGNGRFQLRVPGEFKTPDAIYGLVISTFQGRPIYLKDVAQIVDGSKEAESYSRLDGREAVNLSIKKRVGENIVRICDAIDDLLLKKQMSWPPGTRITKLMDKAKEIRNMVADLENNILSGLLLVIVVLLFVFGFRNATLVALSIPFSMLLSFILLQAMGITLNMVVLFSLTLALGMLVDNAIVIIENIYRYMDQGVPRLKAAMAATSEVAYPVIGSTLTTLAAFFPMMFWPGIMGEFMKYLPLTLIITLTSSLAVALVINPALTSIFIKVKATKKSHASAAEIAAAGEQPIEIKGRILKLYTRFLTYSLDHSFAFILISFGFLVLLLQIWLMSVGLERPVEFFPSIDPKNLYVNIEPPEGADLDYIDGIARKIEMAVVNPQEKADALMNVRLDDQQTLPDKKDQYHFREHRKADGTTFMGPSDLANIEHIYSRTVQNASGGSSFEKNSPNHIGIQFLELKDRLRSTNLTLDDVRKRVADIAGARITVAKQQEGPPTGPPINIEISGDDVQMLGNLAKKIRAIISSIPHVEDVQDDYIAGIPSVIVKVDRQKAAIFGLSTSSIGFALKTAYNGLEVSTFHEDDEDYDITVKLNESDRKVTDVLYKLMIPTPSGQLVPLTTVAQIEYAGSLGDIIRINHQRVVTVKANVDETKIPAAEARLQAEERLKNFVYPPGYRHVFTGEQEEQDESKAFLMRAFMIAILLIFLILVTLFNSVTQPLMILTSVILSLGGVFLGLTVISSPFGIIMTGVGVISLAGVVVNNAIVLIDYTNKLRELGLDLKEAVVSAGATRLRPVLLTAITTVLGLLPMVTGVSFDFHVMAVSWVSESTQWWRTMAIVVIFGLMIATFLTLVVVPILYLMIARFNDIFLRSVDTVKRWYWKPFEKYS